MMPQAPYGMAPPPSGGGVIPAQLPPGIKLIPPGQGKRKADDGDDGPEKRMDAADGKFYELKSFIEEYGGSEDDPPKEWLEAKKKPAPCMDFRRGLSARRGCKFSHDGDFGKQAGDGGGSLDPNTGTSLKVRGGREVQHRVVVKNLPYAVDQSQLYADFAAGVKEAELVR